MSPRTALLAATIGLVAVGSAWVASDDPDGLERIAIDLGFQGRAQQLYAAPAPDYSVPSLPSRPGTAVAGLLGALIVGGLAWGSGRLLVRARE